MTISSQGVAEPVVAAASAVALFRSLGDANRLRIVMELAGGELRVVDLTSRLGLAQSTVSAHLSCLRDCGLVTSRPVARQSFYCLTRPELLDLLRSAEVLLARTGNAVSLCPDYGCHADVQPAHVHPGESVAGAGSSTAPETRPVPDHAAARGADERQGLA